MTSPAMVLLWVLTAMLTVRCVAPPSPRPQLVQLTFQVDRGADELHAVRQEMRAVREVLHEARLLLQGYQTRTDTLRCRLHYLAETVGKARVIQGRVGTRGIPAQAQWPGWDDDWPRCAVCSDGYACARPGHLRGRR